MLQKKDWFKLKKYPHIGRRLKENERFTWIEEYIKNPESIKKHSFLPLIHRTSKVRKFRKEYSKEDGILIKKKKNKNRISQGPKKREIYYASHLDSLIYSYYSSLVYTEYEKYLEDYNLKDVVTAYRSISKNIENPESPNKCNIDFANDVFNYIRNYNSEEFCAITFDISSFFDELDHSILLHQLIELVGVNGKLTDDYFNIYKNITRYGYVEIVDLFKLFQNKIIVEDGSKKRVSKIKYLKKEKAVSFCSKEDFIKNKGKLIRNNKYEGSPSKIRKKGIPQGSPISSTLANLYLLKFDKIINDELVKHNGIYRRYSDDMVVVCPLNKKDEIINLFQCAITDVKLRVQSHKTQVFVFKKVDDKLICGEYYSKVINWNKNFCYLGFDFDGQSTYLKSSSISGYYRKMKRTIKRSKYYSKRKTNKNKGEIFKRRILMKYSYKGAKRKRVWLWSEKKKGFIKSDRYDWGNFLSYAYKASNEMDNNKIKGQIKRHWKILNKNLPKKKPAPNNV
tara:strand:- start:975 stop:2501 length:1527 start_codon:yes stop_codon:yes gene_type:complete